VWSVIALKAAFYGPKIDVQVWRCWRTATVSAANSPSPPTRWTSPCPLVAVRKDFGLTYRDKDNSNKTPLCIHRAPLGTHERFIGFLIEHYAGNFPLWLAPDQVRVITLNDDEALIAYAQPIVAELRANMVRVDSDFSATPFKAKIADAEQQRVHTMLIIGGRDMEAGAVSVRLHHGGPQGAKPKAEVVADILASIKERRG
jgi:threonyl-tRNA synthetase